MATFVHILKVVVILLVGLAVEAFLVTDGHGSGHDVARVLDIAVAIITPVVCALLIASINRRARRRIHTQTRQRIL